jgi:hypothetical protein
MTDCFFTSVSLHDIVLVCHLETIGEAPTPVRVPRISRHR